MGKLLLVLALMLAFKNSTAQKTINIYDTKINTLNGRVKITNAKKVIIGKIIISDQIKTKLYLKSFIQKKDTSGEYETELKFINPDNTKLIKTKISINCNASIISARWGFQPGGINIAYGISEGIDIDNGVINYEASEISNGSVLMVIIKSKTKIVPSIKGLDGKVN